MRLSFQKIYPEAIIPKRGSKYSAGLDLNSIHSGIIAPGQTMVVKTGLRLIMENSALRDERDYAVTFRSLVPVAKICSRSGLAAKHSVFVLNAPGIIDYDYRGELMVILHNAGTKPFAFTRGDRVAQLIVDYAALTEAVEVEDIPIDTARGEGGLGSTGIKENAA